MNNNTFSFESSDLVFDKQVTSCSTDAKGSACCSSAPSDKNLKEHWNNIFSTSEGEDLEWYEEVADESLLLIEKCELNKSSKILNVGAGTSTLLKSLSVKGFDNLHAVDISSVALDKLSDILKVDNIKVNTIEDDLTNSKELINENDIDLWHDRAAFHFFTEEDNRRSYFQLLKNCVKVGAYVILAPFNKEGVDKCSGLNVQQYNIEELSDNMGEDFVLLDSFNHIYTSPKGNNKHFIYSLYRRIK